MEIAVILSVHNKKEVALDTLSSVLKYATDKVLLLVDGIYWDLWKNEEIPVYKLEGLNHGWHRSPYRNIALSLMTAYKFWGDKIDWYCYFEYDCLFGSSSFKKDLQEFEKSGYWGVGSDFRRNQTANLSFLERIMKCKFEEVVYLLGACIFYYKDFLKKAMEDEFFDKLLFYTNEFRRGYFPFYEDWDLTEHAFPTMIKQYGGKIAQLSSYKQKFNIWNGNHRKYPIRFRPELEYKEENFLQASIMHPIKTIEEIRLYHKSKRDYR